MHRSLLYVKVYSMYVYASMLVQTYLVYKYNYVVVNFCLLKWFILSNVQSWGQLVASSTVISNGGCNGNSLYTEYHHRQVCTWNPFLDNISWNFWICFRSKNKIIWTLLWVILTLTSIANWSEKQKKIFLFWFLDLMK